MMQTVHHVLLRNGYTDAIRHTLLLLLSHKKPTSYPSIPYHDSMPFPPRKYILPIPYLHNLSQLPAPVQAPLDLHDVHQMKNQRNPVLCNPFHPFLPLPSF